MSGYSEYGRGVHSDTFGRVCPPPPPTITQPIDDNFVEELWGTEANITKKLIEYKLDGETILIPTHPLAGLEEVIEKLVIFSYYSPHSPKIVKSPKAIIMVSFKLSGLNDYDLHVTTKALTTSKSFISEICYKTTFLAKAQSEHSMEDAEWRAYIIVLRNFAQLVPTLKMKDEYFSHDAWENMLVHRTEDSSLCRIQSFQQMPNISTATSLISSIPEDSDQEIIFTDIIGNNHISQKDIKTDLLRYMQRYFDYRTIEKIGSKYNVVGVSRRRLSSYWIEKLNATDNADDPSCLIAHCRYQLYPPNDPDGMKYLKELCISGLKELHTQAQEKVINDYWIKKEEPRNQRPSSRPPIYIDKTDKREPLYRSQKNKLLSSNPLNFKTMLWRKPNRLNVIEWLVQRFYLELDDGLIPKDNIKKLLEALRDWEPRPRPPLYKYPYPQVRELLINGVPLRHIRIWIAESDERRRWMAEEFLNELLAGLLPNLENKYVFRGCGFQDLERTANQYAEQMYKYIHRFSTYVKRGSLDALDQTEGTCNEKKLKREEDFHTSE